MDLRQLRYFVAVAERGGFGAAASALNVAQSALSRHVKQLEHELGGALLERGARGVSITESGKVLLARGRWLLGAVEDIKIEVQTENREPTGTVRLGAPASFADLFYAPLACLFVKRFPRARLEMSEGLTETVCDRLLRADIDLAVVTAPQPNDHIDFEALVVEQLYVVGPPRDPLLKDGRLTRRTFNALPSAIVPLSRNPFPASVPYAFRVDNSTSLKQIVASGIGYGVLPYSAFRQELAAGIISAALLPWGRVDRALAWPRGRPISRAARETAAALKEICTNLVRDGTIRVARTRLR